MMRAFSVFGGGSLSKSIGGAAMEEVVVVAERRGGNWLWHLEHRRRGRGEGLQGNLDAIVRC